MERKLATIVAMDVVGYSSQMERDEAGMLARLQEVRGNIIEPSVAEHHGEIFKLIGDGALAAFASVVDALQSSIAIQKALIRHNLKDVTQPDIMLRIGVHVGDVMTENGDLYGDCVNVAARLESVAQPGEIVLSRQVYDHIGSRLPISFTSLGKHNVKNISRPIEVYRVNIGESNKKSAPFATAFGDYELDTDAFEIRKNGKPLHVEPMIFDLIRYLVESAGRVVTKDEVIEHVWGGRIVSDATVAGGIKAARKVLGDSGDRQQYIRTVRGRGFQFVGNVLQQNQTAKVEISSINNQPVIDDALPVSAKLSGTRPSIAVLPLHVLTPDSAYAGLGDAVSQEVIMELSKLHWLFVTARGSSFQFRHPATDLNHVAQILGVRYLLTGTIGFFDRSCIVALELSQASDGQIIWADRYQLSLDDLLQLKFEIAAQIVSTVEARIQATEAQNASRLATENLDAWSAYHRGLWHMYRFNQKDNEIANQMFSQAVASDPNFARAHAGLSFTHFQNSFLGFSDNRTDEKALAVRYAENGLALDPLDPFVLLTKGRTEWLMGRPDDGLPWLKRSIDLSPNYAFALYNRGLFNVLVGQSEESRGQLLKAIELSPIDPLNYAMLATRAMSYLLEEDYASAAKWSDSAVRAPNAHVHIYIIAAICHELNDDIQAAEDYMRRARTIKRDLERHVFLQAFPFKSEKLLRRATASLNRLGL